MSETTRGVALLLSVLLWAPVVPSFVQGSTTAEEAILLYVAAFALAVGGCAALSALLRAYAPEPEPEPEASVEQTAEDRRARDDLAA